MPPTGSAQPQSFQHKNPLNGSNEGFSSSDLNAFYDFELLLQGVSHAAVRIKLRATTSMASYGFGQLGWDVIATLEPIDECVPKHVATKRQLLETFVYRSRTTGVSKLMGIFRHQPRTISRP